MTAGDSGPCSVDQGATAEGHAKIIQVAGNQIDVAGDYIAGPGPAPRALASLPAVQGELTGRDAELQRLLALLDPAVESAGAVVVSAVAGLAGVGKTTLAVHAAHQAVGRGWFPGGHLFLDLRGYEPSGQVTAGQALGALLRAVCGADAELPVDPGEQAGLYRSQMAALAREPARCCWSWTVPPLPRRSSPCCRAGRGTGSWSPAATPWPRCPPALIDLAVLEPADAAAVIAKFLGGGDPRPGREPQALAELAGYCGYLPLALQITAANLKADPHRSLAGLAGELQDERARLALSYSDEGQTLAVRASFELSYRRLPPDQARLFRLLSLNPTPQFSLDAIAALSGAPAQQARQTAVKLAQAHLTEPVTEQRWRMHDLMRLYSTELTTRPTDGTNQDGQDDRAGALGRLLDHYRNTVDAADGHLRALPGQPVPERFQGRTDALAWLEAEHANLVTAVTLTATTHPRTAITLAACLAVFLNQRRHFNDAITTAHHALTAARHLDDQLSEGVALNNLGLALAEVRRFEEAVTAHTQAVDIFRESADRHREGTALNNLGNALQEVRRFEEAVAAHTQAVDIFRESADRHREGTALNNLGNALQEVRRFEEAVAAHTQAGDIFRESGDRHGEGMALGNLGLALAGVGRFEEAVAAHTQAGDIFRESGDRHGEGMALGNLGLALQEVRRFEEAVAAHTQAGDIFRESGDRHGEGMALGNLGLALAGVGRFEEAVAAHTQAGDIFRETADRHGEGMSLNNLGLALAGVGRFEEAVAAHTQAGDTCRESADRHGEGKALNNLGLALQEVGRFEEAVAAHTQAGDIYRETADRHGEGTSQDNLGPTQREAREAGRVRGLWRAVTGRKRVDREQPRVTDL